MIFTTAAWLEEFGRALAEADTKYFELREAATEAARAAEPRRRRRLNRSAIDDQRKRQLADVERELDAAGL
ncbi:MAG: hypothetical protein KDA54_22750 [Phycisphaerales bacterium]|nr:hypothetical protein [Phycisphaerales bacterium]